MKSNYKHGHDNTDSNNLFRQLTIFFIVIYVFTLIRTAWLNDDAWFTMRTVYNFIHGYGLTWNVTERVQIYTHPLWMFLLSASYFFIREPLIILYLVPIVVSTATITFILWNFPRNILASTFCITAILFSKAFIDYSTSGLENPLTHLILMVFMYVFFTWKDHPKKILYLSLLTALAAANRLDTILIYIPALIYSLYKEGIKKNYLYFILGMLPLILWELFSIYYYGFPFPNTAYAKLNTGIAPVLLFRQGINYFIDSINRDHITLPIILFGFILTLISRKPKNLAIEGGILLYILYILRIGGDNMSGRIFTAIFISSLIVVMREIRFKKSMNHAVFIIALLLIGLTEPAPPIFSQLDYVETPRFHGISDTRAGKYPTTALKEINFKSPKLKDLHYKKGILANEKNKKLTIGNASGEYAYYAGPNLHVVDTFALGDALLSRLPPIEQVNFRIGHFVREVPKGYWKNYWSYGDKIQDPSLAEYYQKLSIVIHGDNLFSRQRFIEIWRLNTGYYNYLIDDYLNNK